MQFSRANGALTQCHESAWREVLQDSNGQFRRNMDCAVAGADELQDRKTSDSPIIGDLFGFDGLGKTPEEYVLGKVVALAQAGDGAVLFLGCALFSTTPSHLRKLEVTKSLETVRLALFLSLGFMAHNLSSSLHLLKIRYCLSARFTFDSLLGLFYHFSSHNDSTLTLKGAMIAENEGRLISF